MTDCYDIYFPAGKGVVKELKNGRIFNSGNAGMLQWLLHEIAHSKQCNKWGGRYTYADKWFSQIPGAPIEAIITKRTNISHKSIHDKMPMEAAAEKKAYDVMTHLGYKYDKTKKRWIKGETKRPPARTLPIRKGVPRRTFRR
jgi:hypothetical protein